MLIAGTQKAMHYPITSVGEFITHSSVGTPITMTISSIRRTTDNSQKIPKIVTTIQFTHLGKTELNIEDKVVYNSKTYRIRDIDNLSKIGTMIG